MIVSVTFFLFKKNLKPMRKKPIYSHHYYQALNKL